MPLILKVENTTALDVGPQRKGTYRDAVLKALPPLRRTYLPTRGAGAQRRTYFVRCGGFVKIGIAWNVRHRLCGLQVGNPEPLELLGELTGDHEIELHGLFREYRHRGEWFRLEGTLAEYLGKSNSEEQ
jgi:hypothetical protein